MEENKIIIYQTEDGQTKIDVRLENETVWLTQAQMAELFEKTPQNITMHIGNVYKKGELERDSTCKEYLQVQRACARNSEVLLFLVTRKMIPSRAASDRSITRKTSSNALADAEACA